MRKEHRLVPSTRLDMDDVSIKEKAKAIDRERKSGERGQLFLAPEKESFFVVVSLRLVE